MSIVNKINFNKYYHNKMSKFELLYPIFLMCLNFIEDNYWKVVYEDLSHGKCPYGLYIKNDYLCCNYKNKKFNYKIEDKDPHIFYTETFDLLKNKFGLLSNSDKETDKSKFLLHQQELLENTYDDWNNIKKKNIKLLFIEQYIIENQKKYNLSRSDCQKLLNIVLLGVLLKTITSNDIVFVDKKIKKIEGISFKQNKFINNINLFNHIK